MTSSSKMELYITFNKESDLFTSINDIRIEYVKKIKKQSESNTKSKSNIELIEDGIICHDSVYSKDYDNHTVKIIIPNKTTDLYFLTCSEWSGGGDWSGDLCIYVEPSLEEIREQALDYYNSSHNITSQNEPDECHLKLCKNGDSSLCIKHMLDELENDGNFNLECTGLEGSLMNLYKIPI